MLRRQLLLMMQMPHHHGHLLLAHRVVLRQAYLTEAVLPLQEAAQQQEQVCRLSVRRKPICLLIFHCSFRHLLYNVPFVQNAEQVDGLFTAVFSLYESGAGAAFH